MSQDCPLCFNKEVFPSWCALKDSLVYLCSRNFTCPICSEVHEGLEKFTAHLVSHENDTKNNVAKVDQDVPTISIKEGGQNLDSLDELLADFSDFVRQEDKTHFSYDNQVKLKTKAPNPLRTSPKSKIPLSPPPLPSFHGIQTPLPLHQQQPNLILNSVPPPLNNIQLQDRPVFVPPPAMPQMDTNSHQLPQISVPPVNHQLLHQNIDCKQAIEPKTSPPPSVDPPPDSSPPPLSNGSNAQNSSPTQVQCKLCGWNFDNDNFLQLHMVLMHSKRNQALLQRRLKKVVEEYTCRECEGTFKLYEDFVNHLRQVHNDHRFVCHICAKIFKLKGSLLVHLRVVHNPLGEGAHHCKVCNRKFTNKHRKDVHEKKHVDVKPFECAKCGLAFEEKGEFEIHMETHKTQHVCHLCGRSFYTQAALFIHTMGHQNHESAESSLDVAPSLSSTLKVPECTDVKPVITEQPEAFEVPQGFKCPTCEKVFKRESHLNQHVKCHDNRQWECDVCKKVFTTKYFLKKHKRLHTGETPYACNICGKSFTFQQSYHKHMLYHTDDKPYSCSQCGRAFKELSTLQNHERIHSGERPFACETCGKSFRQRVSYLVHRRIHTGVMPYVCNDCGKSFRYKVTQRTHKCVGKIDGSVPQIKPVVNPLAEDNASIKNDQVAIDLPQQIKDDLLSFRKTQGRKYIQGRLQGYLQKSKERSHNQNEMPSPLNQLEQLSLSDQQSMPNIESILFNEPAKEDPSIKTECVDDFDLQAFL